MSKKTLVAIVAFALFGAIAHGKDLYFDVVKMYGDGNPYTLKIEISNDGEKEQEITVKYSISYSATEKIDRSYFAGVIPKQHRFLKTVPMTFSGKSKARITVKLYDSLDRLVDIRSVDFILTGK